VLVNLVDAFDDSLVLGVIDRDDFAGLSGVFSAQNFDGIANVNLHLFLSKIRIHDDAGRRAFCQGNRKKPLFSGDLYPPPGYRKAASSPIQGQAARSGMGRAAVGG
jgi:hypothetical protein